MSKMEEKGKERVESASKTLSDESEGNMGQLGKEMGRAPESPISNHIESVARAIG